jgi:hypothetical protein
VLELLTDMRILFAENKVPRNLTVLEWRRQSRESRFLRPSMGCEENDIEDCEQSRSPDRPRMDWDFNPRRSRDRTLEKIREGDFSVVNNFVKQRPFT